MSTFIPTTGCVGTLCPPFSSDQEYSNYMTALKTAGVIQTIQESRISTNTTGQQMKITSNLFPAVQVVSFGKFDHYSKDVTLAIVYINPAGRAMFAYKNDPANQISLIDGGCQIAPQTLDLAQTATAKTGAPPRLFVFFIVCIILVIISLMVYFYFKLKKE
jgi:hypothetical protein